MEANVKRNEFLGVAAPAVRVIKQEKSRAPDQTWRGQRTDGEVLVFLQGLGSPETTLPPHHQVISLAHFTGGEAHRLPHFTATSLWERGEREMRELCEMRRSELQTLFVASDL